MPESEDRKITSVSFDKILWANFRREAKRRGEQVQDVFDRLMFSYLHPNGSVPSKNKQNTNAAGETEQEEEEEEDVEGDGGFTVEPHLPGFGSNRIEIDDESDAEEEEAEFEENPFNEQSDEEEE